jgi:hypothetical protein
MHYKHTHYVFVQKLGLGINSEYDWKLQALFADDTDDEAKISSKSTESYPFGLTKKHQEGYADVIDPSCTLRRGQKDGQTRIWPGTKEAPLLNLSGLVLRGLSQTPWSLILQFEKLYLQV